MREDLPRGFHEAVTAFLDRFPGKIDEFEALLTKNDMFMRRTQGVGVISAEDALAWGLVGPIARGSGVDFDVRKYFPYSGYETYDFEVPTGTEGDVFARYRVRVAEMRQSVKIARQAIQRARHGQPRVVLQERDERVASQSGEGGLVRQDERLAVIQRQCTRTRVGAVDHPQDVTARRTRHPSVERDRADRSRDAGRSPCHGHHRPIICAERGRL